MNRDEVVKTLLTRARIDPGFTTLGILGTYLNSFFFSLSIYVLFFSIEYNTLFFIAAYMHTHGDTLLMYVLGFNFVHIVLQILILILNF